MRKSHGTAEIAIRAPPLYTVREKRRAVPSRKGGCYVGFSVQCFPQRQCRRFLTDGPASHLGGRPAYPAGGGVFHRLARAVGADAGRGGLYRSGCDLLYPLPPGPLRPDAHCPGKRALAPGEADSARAGVWRPASAPGGSSDRHPWRAGTPLFPPAP